MRRNLDTIKNDLWTCRKKMGLSQKGVAYLMRMKRTNDLSRYEHCKRLPNLKNALKLEIVYRTPVAFLFGELYRRLRDEIKRREERLKNKDDKDG
jgi:transcriptional regulator with XRE-family HTH domain